MATGKRGVVLGLSPRLTIKFPTRFIAVVIFALIFGGTIGATASGSVAFTSSASSGSYTLTALTNSSTYSPGETVMITALLNGPSGPVDGAVIGLQVVDSATSSNCYVNQINTNSSGEAEAKFVPPGPSCPAVTTTYVLYAAASGYGAAATYDFELVYPTSTTTVSTTSTTVPGQSTSTTSTTVPGQSTSTTSTTSFASTTQASSTTGTQTSSPTPKGQLSIATPLGSALIQLYGNVSSSQITQLKVEASSPGEYVLSFTVTGPSGMKGNVSLGVGYNVVPPGLVPVIRVDGELAQNQQVTEGVLAYYISFVIHFSTHQISIDFIAPSTRTTTTGGSIAIGNAPQQGAGVYDAAIPLAAAVIFAVLAVAIFHRRRSRANGGGGSVITP